MSLADIANQFVPQSFPAQKPGVELGYDHRVRHYFGAPRHTTSLRGAPSSSKYTPHMGRKQINKRMWRARA